MLRLMLATMDVIDPHVGGCVKIMQVTNRSCCVLFQLSDAYCA